MQLRPGGLGRSFSVGDMSVRPTLQVAAKGVGKIQGVRMACKKALR